MTKINIIYINLLDNIQQIDNLLSDKNSFILLNNDSLGTIINTDYENILNNYISNLDEFEKKLKDKISYYKFKTLQNRFYLPIGSSILLNFDEMNFIYSPIMWLKQDISNTNNIYWAFKSSLSLILKKSILEANNEEKNILIFESPKSPTAEEQRIKAFNEYEQDLNNKEDFKNSLDYKEDPTIFFKECNISEQPPFLQNNEFRELSYN